MNIDEMKLKTLITCLLMAFVPIVASADDDISLVGQAQQTVIVGNKFKVRYTLNNAKSTDIREGECEAIEKLFGPSYATSSNVSIVNGQISSTSTVTFEYVYKATKVGSYSISPASITIDGTRYTSNAIKLNIVEEGSSSSQSSSSQSSQSSSGSSSSSSSASLPQGEIPDIMIRQTLNRTSVYEGEAVVLNTKIYTRVDLNSISDIKSPELSEFLAQDLFNGALTFEREVVDGVVYNSALAMSKVLIPQKSGTIKIDPITYEFIVKQRTSSRGGGFFSGFFDDVQLVRRSVKSNSLSIKVKPLPDGKPHNFSGGVGDMKFSVSVSPTEVDADNSVQVKVSVSGEGNLKLVTLPKPQFHSDFDTFDPSETSNLEATQKGFKGSRSAEYLIIPRVAGEFEIPALQFSYFNPSTGKYQTLTQGPFTVTVNKGDGTATQSGGVAKAVQGQGSTVVYNAYDLRYLHTADQDVKKRASFFILSPEFFGLCGILLVIFALCVAYFVKRNKDQHNVSGVKMRRANKAARRRLKLAAKLSKENKREAFFDEVMRALWGYLSDKLALPLSELTKDNAKDEMQRYGIDTEAADKFMALLDDCEFARYAPADMTKPMDEIYRQATEVISLIDSNIKK